MTTPTYPLDKLPYPVRDNYTSQYGSAFKRAAMDDGHGRVRRRWDQQPIMPTLTWTFAEWSQLDLFEGFIKYDCAQASGWFIMPLFPGDTPKTMRMTTYPTITFDTSIGTWQATVQVEYIRLGPTGYSATPTVLPQFPSSLPEPEKDNYQITRASTMVRSNLPDGEATERARFKEEVATFTVTWYLAPDEYAVFDSFVHNQLLGGLAPFTGYFSNGRGDNLVRVNFVDTPVVSEEGACYKVTASCETRDIPQMSEFDYLGLNKLALSDSFILAESIYTQEGVVGTDLVTYVEKYQFALSRGLSDNYSLTESLKFKITANRNPVENITWNEQYTFSLTNGQSDYISWKTNGEACWNQYCTNDYVSFGYTADCQQFAAETDGNESISFTESVVHVLSAVRPFAENLTFTVSGSIKGQRYCGPDYCDPSYTMDQIQAF
jgi:hypothetical protein